ncbi:MAG: hypothetical protein LBK02_09245 [Treponema sp.]|nr:hypothetical protein [Treponema sp.]
MFIPIILPRGHTLAELEKMLADVYHIRQEEEKRLAQRRKTGILKLEVSA